VRYARNPEVLWRSTSRGPVVLVPGREGPDRLGGVAAVVWEVLDDPMDAVGVEAAVVTLTGGAAAAREALDRLCDEGLLQRVG
jgi:hypothetical protein